MAQGPLTIEYSNKVSLEEVIPDVRSCFSDSRFHLVGYFKSGKSTDRNHFAFCLAVVCTGRGLMLVCMMILNREHSTLQLLKKNIFKAEFSIVWVVV